jgi:orotidine-5'-phosphate decarboxylase
VVMEMSHRRAELFMPHLKRIRLSRPIIGELIIISPVVGDQRGNPGAALDGADYIVSMPIYQAEDPEGSAKKLLSSLRSPSEDPTILPER